MDFLAQIETATKFIDHAAAQDMRWWFLGLLVVGGAAIFIVARYFTARHDKMSERLDKVQDQQVEYFKTSNAQLVNVIAESSSAMKQFSETVAAVKHLFEGKKPLLLFGLCTVFSFALGACAHQSTAPHFSAPSTNAIQRDTSKARVAVAAAHGNVKTAQSDLTAAQQQASTLAAAAPQALQAPVQNLQARLQAVSVDLAAADEHAAGAESAFQAADQHELELQTQIDGQADLLNQERAGKNEAIARADRSDADARHQTALAWKWRLIAAAEALAVAGFFVARQYLPFLKLI